MFKEKRAALFLITIIILSQGPVRAENPVTKLGRGVENVVTSPVEFLTQYMVAGEQGNPVSGIVVGTLFGAGMTVVRILAGVYEIVSFPFPLPKNYEPLLDPETPMAAFRRLQ